MGKTTDKSCHKQACRQTACGQYFRITLAYHYNRSQLYAGKDKG